MNKTCLNLKKLSLLLYLPLLWGVSAIGAPVNPDAAKAEGLCFLSENGSNRKAVRSSADLSLAYTAEENSLTAFYVFNCGNGFIIVSADDRLPSVLGYSDNGNFDYDKIPENFKWWLNEYCREITHWLPIAPEETLAPVKRASAKRTPIAPLTKTTWNQDSPYNDQCPLDNTGRRSVTGCVATAMAQLMKYHEWPLNPTGSSGGVVFDGTTYDWKRMLDNYEPNKYTPAEASAVATLMRQCGAGVNMMYSSWASGAYDNQVPNALINYFGYNPAIKMVWKDYTPLSTWTETVYGELAAGRPVYYSGSSNQGGHAFVCDGYSENDYFHFNWGWGGYQDGYFRLTALNPSSGGAGSYEGGYNSGQTIITGLEPNKTGATAPQQVALLSTGGFYYDSDNTFSIKNDPRGFNLIYNPMVYSITVSIGIKIEEIDNPSGTPKYASAGSSTIRSGYGFSEINITVPSMPDGTYSITPVFAQKSEDWEPIMIPLGKQNYVRMTVANGKQSFENAGPDDSNKANLIVNMPITTPVIYSDTDLAFRLPVLNVGQGDYMGYLGFTLVNEEDEFGDAVSMSDSAPVSGKSYSEWEVTFDEPISAGTYHLYVTDDDGDMLIEGETITVVDGDFPPIVTNKVSVENLAPNFIEADTENPIYFTVKSSSIFEETVPFRFTILDATSLEKVKELPEYALQIPSKYEGRVVVRPHDLGIAPGYYLWYVADTDGNCLSRPTPLIVTSSIKTANGLAYKVIDEKNKIAKAVAPASGAYTSSVTVPESVNGYKITELCPDAFAFATSPEVTLSKNITSIPDGGFYDTYALRTLNIEANEILAIGANTFYPKYISNCWLNVPDGFSNAYHQSKIWNNFHMTHWQLLLEDVEIASGMEIDPATGLAYAPYYVNCLTPLTVTFSAPSGKNVGYDIIHNGDWIAESTINPLESSVTLPAMGRKGSGRLHAYATDNAVSVESIFNDGRTHDVFSVDGRVILRNASANDLRNLDPGVYVIAGKKHLVK